MKYYKMAGLYLCLDFPDKYIYKCMDDFCIETQDNFDCHCKLHLNEKNMRDFYNEFGNEHPLVSSRYLVIYKALNGFMLFYPGGGELLGCFIDVQSLTASIYVNDDDSLHPTSNSTTCENCRESENDSNSNSCAGCISNTMSTLTLCERIFFCIRDCFFVFMQAKGILAIHSSSVLYKEKAYIFSASSGTGKTTHTNFWIENYDATILDGDITAVAIKDNIPTAYGLPWCGTSKKYQNTSAPLAMIIFLKQFNKNEVIPLSFFDATLKLTARCFTPTWTTDLASKNLTLAQNITDKIQCVILNCLPDKSAAELIKSYIEG